MDIFIKLLIVLHIFGLVLTMGSGISMAVLGPLYGTSSDEQRGFLFKVGKLLGRNAMIGLAVLWVSGPLVLFLKYGGASNISHWFWAKLVLVVILSASLGMGSAAFRKFAGGDMGASARVALTSKINLTCGLLIILCAVFAFN